MARAPVIALALLLALAPAQARGEPRTLAKNYEGPIPRNALNDIVENIRTIIREGSEDLNLPVLDPFELESVSTSMEEEGAYEVSGGLRNFVATGLGDFEEVISVRQIIPFSRIGITVELSVPILQIIGQYSADGLLGEVVHLYGDGNAKVAITELKLTFDAVIRVGYFTESTLLSLDAEIDVGNFQFELDGLLEGGMIDSLFSLVVNELAKVIFQGQKANLEHYLVSLLEEPLQEVIKGFGMSDILCAFLGLLCPSDNGLHAVRADQGSIASDVDGPIEEGGGVGVVVADTNGNVVLAHEAPNQQLPKRAPEFERATMHRRSRNYI